MKNRQWRLTRQAPPGETVTPEHFEPVDTETPAPGAGEVLLRTIYLSLDPYMRGRISPAKSYAPPVQPGQVMVGEAVAEVVDSRADGLAPGDLVAFHTGWQEYALAAGDQVRKLDLAGAPPSAALSVLGMPGLTAYYGLLEVGRPAPGETVVVTAASGAVGSVVGQLAKIKGCRAIAIASSAAKVAYCTGELGYDAGIAYRECADIAAAVGAAAPDGVHVFFDNVGGSIHQGVIQHLALRARIVICGVMAQNNPVPGSEPVPYDLRRILATRARMEGILVTDFADRTRALAEMAAWHREGRLKFRETVAEGFEAIPAALLGLLKGENFGKQLVRLAPEPAPR